jgi:hypothetical protein
LQPSIIAGAKRHLLEPWAYARDVILQPSVDANPELLDRLLPDRWAMAHPEHVQGRRLEGSRQKASGETSVERICAHRVSARRDDNVIAVASPSGPVPACSHSAISNAYAARELRRAARGKSGHRHGMTGEVRASMF